MVSRSGLSPNRMRNVDEDNVVEDNRISRMVSPSRRLPLRARSPLAEREERPWRQHCDCECHHDREEMFPRRSFLQHQAEEEMMVPRRSGVRSMSPVRSLRTPEEVRPSGLRRASALPQAEEVRPSGLRRTLQERASASRAEEARPSGLRRTLQADAEEARPSGLRRTLQERARSPQAAEEMRPFPRRTFQEREQSRAPLQADEEMRLPARSERPSAMRNMQLRAAEEPRPTNNRVSSPRRSAVSNQEPSLADRLTVLRMRNGSAPSEAVRQSLNYEAPLTFAPVNGSSRFVQTRLTTGL